MQETEEMQIQSLDQEDPLEEGMATHSSILAWRIPWTEEPGKLQSTGSHRVGYGWNNVACTLTGGMRLIPSKPPGEYCYSYTEDLLPFFYSKE